MKEVLKCGPCLVDADDDQVSLRLNPSIWVDVIAFDRRMQSITFARPSLIDAAKRLQIKRALDMYRGDFAACIDAHWALIERERLRTMFLDGLFVLANSYSSANDWAPAAATARKLCRAEPLREDAHRLLMIAWAKMGNRALCVRQFEECRATLARELNVQPMRETVELYLQLSGATAANAGGSIPLGSEEFRNAVLTARDSVNEALGVLEAALAAANVHDVEDPVLPP